MPTEIERKFLVRNRPWNESTPFVDMVQGYISDAGSHASVRVRLQSAHDHVTAGYQGYLTIKGPSVGAAREEFEYPIPHAEAARMICALCRTRVRKRRYLIRHGQHEWHVDKFLDGNEPLVTAEIELSSESEIFEMPDWIGQEVTTDPRFSNASLAESPYSRWQPH